MDGNALAIFAVLGSCVASLSFVGFAHFIVAATHGVPHSWIFRPGEDSPAVVVKRIVVHVLKLIGLTETVPSSEIFGIDFNSISIGFDGSWYIFHLEVLMTHQCPGRQTGSIKFQSFSEVNDSFEMFSHERVVVSNNTASLRNVLVIVKFFQSQVSKLTLILFDVKDVRVGVHIFKTKRIQFK